MDELDSEFEALLTYLKESRGFDFTGYKRSSLSRRVHRRMSTIPVTGYGDYLDYLQVHPDEFTALFNTILINVTAFFRDAEAWDFLRSDVLLPMLAAKPEGSPIRIWSAGCASGQEACTLAMLLGEILGPEQFHERVKIYATDVDEEQLNEARHASYSARDVESVPPGLLERYFEVIGNRYVFRKDMRRSVIFGRNDLVQDAPISRVDLLTCRNTLMYFNAETQARILNRFHFALAEGGALFLGKAEMLLSHSSLFLPIDLKRRIFRKVPTRPMMTTGIARADQLAAPAPTPLVGLDQLRNAALMAAPAAQIVVTVDGLVALTNHQAESLFGVSPRDVGRPFRDLDVSYRPVELRRYLEQVQVERRALHVPDVEWTRGPGETRYLDIQVTPLVDGDAGLLGVSLIFHDVSAAKQLRVDLERANRELEAAYEELQSTNEELETTNEELQSTVEELETTNEELQSTNEELETMNEELQSTNDELQSINEQLHNSSADLDGANAFLDAILSGLRAGIAVVDRDLRVLVWNRQAEELWGLRSGEAIDKHLLNLDIGLPVDQIRPLIRASLSGETTDNEIRLEAVNRRGRSITVRVACSPLLDVASVPTGSIIVMDAVAPSA
ncbi:chemotaxis protein CheR [Actinoplanes sp. SE50]|uniref:CheR family methyltransferase n=1 Tax=unclassified Actinoplanes TaxID=2626549 RepID=UPI00023EC5CB|nr:MULTISPECIES: CheR family methyltransferase [unclassified Actinoplanes]AEV83621.1 chemotaxis protein methyltransferase CheR [Actinoplanes sp. SE50/110]ATO82235.1 chemotaxis protein CheR [Actinoplanes sp. SE50]SLL99642.1 chemotaxis protein CheR [Actinoplanes sp. SE50/110]